MDTFSRLLPAILRKVEDSPEAREHATFAAWNAAVGDNVRRACAPIDLAGRRLTIATIDATWKTQLDRLAPQLTFKMNTILGVPVVTQLSFRVDPDTVRRAHPAPVVIPSGDIERCAKDLAHDAALIEDSSLRDVFLRAAGRCLARREGNGE